MPLSPLLTVVLRPTQVFLQNDATLTFDEPVGDLPAVDVGRWSEALTSHSLGALLVWGILLVVLQMASWPLVRRVFTRLPDRGWGFARPMSIMLSGTALWYLASFHIVQFTSVWAVLAILLFGLACWLGLRRIPLFSGELSWRSNPIAVGAEVVFWAAFLTFLFIRALNPDSYHPIWGGEKPMEFAHLNAILRSAHFPPVDPWYSGGYINYYYYGTYLVAFLIKATGIPVEIAFNLAAATFPAMLAAGSFSLAAALTQRITSSTFGAMLGGIAGAFFVQFAGNLIVAVRAVDRIIEGDQIPNPFVHWVWEPTRAIPEPALQINITEFPYFGALWADVHPHVLAMPFTIMTAALAWQIASGWRGLSIIFIRKKLSLRQHLAITVPIVLLGITLGLIWMTNAWDLPMFAAVGLVGIVMLTTGMPGMFQRLGVIAVATLTVAIVGFLTALPFNMHYTALFSDQGIVTDRTPLLALESHVGGQLLLLTFGISTIVLLLHTQNRRRGWTMAVGPPALLAVSLVLQWITAGQDGGLNTLANWGIVASVGVIWLASAWIAAYGGNDFGVPARALQMLVPMIAVIAILLSVQDRLTLALYLVIGLSSAIMWIGLEKQSERFLVALIAGAALLGGMLEIVYLVDDLDGGAHYRMNTIFKFYNQVWNLLGVATGVIVGVTIWRLFVESTVFEKMPDRVDMSEPWARLTATALIPIALGMLLYPIVATPIRIEQQFGNGGTLTLNSYSWMEYGEIPLVNRQNTQSGNLTYADDLAAINWLNENVEGTPVIAEAAFGTYRCNGSRFSIATGLPAPVGWVRHQQQQRYPDELGQRERDLRTLYTDADSSQQREIIDRYGIEYVIIGQTEEHYPTPGRYGCTDTGNPEAITSLESLTNPTLELVFEQGTTRIYRVIQEQ